MISIILVLGMGEGGGEGVSAGLFYLGARVDEATMTVLRDEPVYLNPSDLNTHAMILGMTGSGKTGTCLVLLEEAILNGIPAILVDPKGDLTNLLLAFPHLKAEDFEPWVSREEAEQQGLTVKEYAEKVAEAWERGLEAWGIPKERVRMLKDAADICIFTPGASFGTPVSILHSLKVPQGLSWDEDEEVLRDKIRGVVSALLEMVGHESDPVKSGEHILLSNIIEQAWRGGVDLDLPTLIENVKEPPMSKLGVVDVDEFAPPKQRRRLAVDLNKILASPYFESWVTGVPMDMDFFFGVGGRPRVSIFYIAHLGERERQFFLTLLLWELYSWMLTNPGAQTVRYIFYFDEIYGYLPPHPYTPPTKRPLTLLLKQGRAYGLSCILATQNPMDVDYKALSNCGIWMIGKLQTARDRERILEGLTSVFEDQGATLDRRTLAKVISSLPPRTFVLHGVKLEGPIVFRTRHLMVYHRGPITKGEVRRLTERQRERLQRYVVRPLLAPKEAARPAPLEAERTVEVAEAIPSYYLDTYRSLNDFIRELRDAFPSYEFSIVSGGPRYQPALHSVVQVEVKRKRPKAEYTLKLENLVPLESETLDLDSVEAYGVKVDSVDSRNLLVQPREPGKLAELPTVVRSPRGIRKLKSNLIHHAINRAQRKVYLHPALKKYSTPGASLEEFKEEIRQEIEYIEKAGEEEIESKLGGMEKQLLEELDEAQARFTTMKRRLDAISKELKITSRRVTEVKKKLKEIKRKIRILEKHEDEATAEEQRLKKQVKRMEKLQIELKKLELEVKSLKEQAKKRKRAERPPIKARIKTREKRIKEIKREIKSLKKTEKAIKKIRKELEKTRKNLGKLKEQQVKLLEKERKLVDAESRIEELREKKKLLSEEIRSVKAEISEKRAELNKIRRRKRRHQAKLGRVVEKLRKAEIREYDVRPRKSEVEISILDLVWVPVYDVEVEVAYEGRSGRFSAHWNGFTGDGWLAQCNVCHAPIPTISELQFCQTCLNALCTRDAVHCTDCGGTFCSEDYEAHLVPCGLCGRDQCPTQLELCPLCGRSVCVECRTVCAGCGRTVCLDDAWTCASCGRQYCMQEPKYPHRERGRYICQSCAVQCPICNRITDKEHAEMCPECGLLVCQDCMTVKGFLFKKRICKRCAGLT